MYRRNSMMFDRVTSLLKNHFRWIVMLSVLMTTSRASGDDDNILIDLALCQIKNCLSNSLKFVKQCSSGKASRSSRPIAVRTLEKCLKSWQAVEKALPYLLKSRTTHELKHNQRILASHLRAMVPQSADPETEAAPAATSSTSISPARDASDDDYDDVATIACSDLTLLSQRPIRRELHETHCESASGGGDSCALSTIHALPAKDRPFAVQGHIKVLMEVVTMFHAKQDDLTSSKNRVTGYVEWFYQLYPSISYRVKYDPEKDLWLLLYLNADKGKWMKIGWITHYSERKYLTRNKSVTFQ